MAAVATGDDASFIAASQRPDGSWRKPRRVKEGYTPQDEVPLYESKGKHFTKRPNQYPVGLDPAMIQAAEMRKEKQNQNQWTEVTSRKNSPIPGLVVDDKKKKKQIADTITAGLGKVKLNKDGNKKETAKKTEKKVEKKVEKVEKKEEETSQDPAKRIKNLRKRLREIEAIELKISSGELKKLEKDQVDKVARKKEYLAEIEQLEFAVK